MNTTFAKSPDNTLIAYDIQGTEPALLLLHGGWRSRQDWHEHGYVVQLKERFTVVIIDIRGKGESDKPTESAAYTITKLCEDILAVADVCSIDRFALWGFSYGGNIGRFLAARSDRVTKFIIMGIPFGPAASARFRNFIENYCAHWRPIIAAQRNGTLDLATLSTDDQQDLQEVDVAVAIAWLNAMLDWGAIEPADLRCPTLWLVGSANETAMASVKAYEQALPGTPVQVAIIDGLDHAGELKEIDKVLPVLTAFTVA